MGAEKTPLTIECNRCHRRFRLWLPEHPTEGQKPTMLYCIGCAAPFRISYSDGSPKLIAPGDSPAPSGSTHRVLYVDDDRLSIAMVRDALSDMVELTTTPSATEALERLKAEDYSLLITDLHLKDPSNPEEQLDGEELIARLRELKGGNIPVIITTGEEIIDELIMDPKWLKLNVKAFIQKGNPFWQEELKTKVKEILEIY